MGKSVDCSAFADAANQPYINVLYANSLWCTDSQRIAFGCSPNVRHTAECYLPRLRNTSTRTFASFSHAAFAFCSHSDVKRGFRLDSQQWINDFGFYYFLKIVLWFWKANTIFLYNFDNFKPQFWVKRPKFCFSFNTEKSFCSSNLRPLKNL